MADLIIMPSLALHRRAVHVLAVRLGQPRQQHVVHAGPRHRLHHGHDVDLRRRHRAQRAHADGAAASPSSSCSCCSVVVALVKALRPHARLRPPVAVVAHADATSAASARSATALLVAVFIYWGWDTAVERQRGVREREHHARPRRRALDVHPRRDLRRSCAFAAQCGARRRLPLEQPRRRAATPRGKIVFGTSGLGTVAFKLLIIAVLTSSAASCQTTILPAARTALSMAIHRAFPPKLGEVDAAPPHAGVLDVVLRHRVVRVAHACSCSLSRYSRRRRAHVVGRRRRPDDRLLLRADRHRLRRLLPPLHLQEREELHLRRPAAADRRAHARVHLRVGHQGLRRPDARRTRRRAGSASSPVLWIGLGTLLAGIPLDVLVEHQGPRVLPGQDRPDRLAARRPKAASRSRSSFPKERPADGRRGRPRIRRRTGLAGRAANRGRDRGRVQAAAGDRVRLRAARRSAATSPTCRSRSRTSASRSPAKRSRSPTRSTRR